MYVDLWSVNFHPFESILLLTKKHSLAGASLVSLGKQMWEECAIGMWVVGTKGVHDDIL